MEWFYDLIDLPENLQRGLYVCRPIRGLSAALMAGVLFYLCWLLWPWLFKFDIESTQVWAAAALNSLTVTTEAGTAMANQAMPALAAYNENIAWFATGVTFIPTLVELFAVRFASAKIKVASILVLFFSTFDLITDWPAVSTFIDSFKMNPALAFLLKIPMLLLASFGLQSLFIIFLVCGFALVLNARTGNTVGRRHPNAAPAGSVDV